MAGEVSVVGFDDIADATDCLPPLTTVRQEFDELGERAVDALIGAIDGGSPKTDLVPTRLIVRRESTGGSPVVRDREAMCHPEEQIPEIGDPVRTSPPQGSTPSTESPYSTSCPRSGRARKRAVASVNASSSTIATTFSPAG